MTNFQINQGPLQRGLKPAAFFAQRKRMMELSILKGNGGLVISDEYKNTNSHKHTEKKFKPEQKGFYEILPWTLFIGMMLYGMIL